jgi:PAS domain S-box-containing protein
MKKKAKIILSFTLLFVIGAVSSYFLYQLFVSQNLKNANVQSLQQLENELVPPKTAFQLMEGSIPSIIPHLKKNTNENTQEILINIKTVINASIVYLMNKDGKVIASTIYGENNSLLNEVYAFRPYFLQAMAGENTIYEAKGVTTHEKGIYYSVPLFDEQKANVIGVLVAKLSLNKIDFWIQKLPQITLLVNSDGIIFSTNVKEWLYAKTKDISTERMAEIEKNQQFGKEAINSLPIDIFAPHVLMGKNRYLVKVSPIILDDWQLVTLQKYDIKIPILITVFLFFFCLLFALNMIYFLTFKKRIQVQFAEIEKKENELKDSLHQFSAIYDSTVDAVMILDDDVFVDCNQQTLNLFKTIKKEFISKKPYELSPPKQADGRDSKEKAIEMINKALHGENQLFDWQHKKMTGEIFDAQISLNPFEKNERKYILAVVRDVSEQKKNVSIQQTLFQIANAVNTTSNLRELFQSIQNSLQRIMDTRNFFIALYDKETETISLPYQKDEMEEVQSFPAGKSATAYVIRTKQSLLATEEDYNQLIASGEVEQIGPKSKVLLMIPLIIDDEVIGVVAVQSYENAHQYSIQDKQILEFVSDEIATAIKKKQMETEREVEKAYFEQLFNVSPEAIAICDTQGIVQKVNQTFQKIFQYPEDEVVGKNLDTLISNESDSLEMNTKTAQFDEWEANRRRKDGTIIPVSILQKSIIIGGGDQAIYSIYRDISDKKSDEMEIESQKEHLQLINKILRHDLMNSLSVINSALKLFRRTNEETYIDSAFLSIQGSIELIKKMREMEDFISHHNHLRIYDAHELIQRHIPVTDKLAITNEASGKILADDSVESVISNLINNVIMHAKAKQLKITSEYEQDFMIVHFADNGKGIPEKIRTDIFKENFHYGKTGNTGLGLFIVKKAMESFGGKVFVTPNQPKGSIFTLAFRTVKIK